MQAGATADTTADAAGAPADDAAHRPTNAAATSTDATGSAAVADTAAADLLADMQARHPTMHRQFLLPEPGQRRVFGSAASD